MMVETILESSQDFVSMSGGVPQWKRELLQRRAARPRPAPPPPPPPPPAPPPPDDEELRYGPGIVKRLQSRYLSLALRDAPRRRSSLLRRAASLEHLLDAPPPPPRPRPASHAYPPAARRESIKRARSVDALSRFERRAPESSPAPEPSPAPAPAPKIVPAPAPAQAQAPVPVPLAAPPAAVVVSPPPPSSPPTAPPLPRAGRPPRRPQPLLREAERPPADLVRAALRKFEPGAARRAAPAARVAAVLRGLEPRTSTPEPRARPASPAGPTGPASPAVDLSAIEEPEREAAGPRPVSRAALDGIARAGSSVLFSFGAARAGSHLPPLAATNVALVARRVGVIRPLPPAPPPPPPQDDEPDKAAPRLASPPPAPAPRKRSPPAVAVAVAAEGALLNGHGGRARRKGASPPQCTSIVFNFSSRAAVPDYIENDGLVLRASRRDKLKAGDPGVVVLRAGAGDSDSDSEGGAGDAADGGVEALPVRFVNDNVLINGRSSLAARKDRPAKVKLQFDDSLTRTHEYPSEASLCEDDGTAHTTNGNTNGNTNGTTNGTATGLAANTHIASAALSGYTPSKTLSDAFQLGVTRHDASDARLATAARDATPLDVDASLEPDTPNVTSWSEARAGHTDLLF